MRGIPAAAYWISEPGARVVFGGLGVLLGIPVAAVLVTLLDVLVLKKDPAEEDVPSVIFPPADSQEA